MPGCIYEFMEVIIVCAARRNYYEAGIKGGSRGLAKGFLVETALSSF